MTNTETSPQSGGPSTQQTVDDAVLKAASVVRIVDDDVAMRRSYEFMLTMAKWRTKLYDSAEAFLDGDDPEIPGAIILDVRMPGISGLALQDRLSADGNDLPVIFVTGHGDVDMAVRAVKHGAFEFMLKPVDPVRLKAAVTDAIRSSWVKAKEARETIDFTGKWALLTDREREVFSLIAEGCLNKEAAYRLDIAERTVKFHRASACRKLGVRTPQEIAALWLKLKENGKD